MTSCPLPVVLSTIICRRELIQAIAVGFQEKGEQDMAKLLLTEAGLASHKAAALE